MKIFNILFLSTGLLVLVGCSKVQVSVTNQYQLSAYSTKQWAKKPKALTLMLTPPEAVAGYQTQQMLYVKRPFQIESFAKNGWISPPAEMLYPLLAQSLQRTGYFYAVATSPTSSEADYRLDTLLLALEQNFLRKTSIIDFSAKIILTRISDNKVVASQIINEKIGCPEDTPYGGVIAANQASALFTENVTHFVISYFKNH